MNYVTPTNYLELVQGYMGMLKAHLRNSVVPQNQRLCFFWWGGGGGVGVGSLQ